MGLRVWDILHHVNRWVKEIRCLILRLSENTPQAGSIAARVGFMAEGIQ